MPVDATAASLSEEIGEAREALLELMHRQPDRKWTAYELKAEARNGWSAGAMSIALNRLIDDGLLVASGDSITLAG